MQVLQSLTVNSRKVYLNAWYRFLSFIKTINVSPAQVSSNHLSLYISKLHQNHFRTSTIKSHMSAIGFMFEAAGLQNPTKSFIIQKQLIYFNKNQTPSLSRKPINSNILKKLIHHIPKITHNKYDQLLYKSMFTLMYHAALRGSEVCKTPTTKHTIQFNQIEPVTSKTLPSIKIRFISYKHSTSDIPSLIVRSTDDITCPVTAFRKYSRLRGNNPGPAFQDQSSSPITRQMLLSILQQCLIRAGLSLDSYNTHSFRIGKTTDLVKHGMSYPKISLIGRWKSKAFLHYIKPQTIHN